MSSVGICESPRNEVWMMGCRGDDSHRCFFTPAVSSAIVANGDQSGGLASRKLTLVNHFKRVAIRIKHVRCVIAGIIFKTSTRRDIVLCARSDGSLVEGVYRSIVFCAEAPVDRGWIRLPLFQP